MPIFAIDPGTTESAFVIVADDLSEVYAKGKIPNEEMLDNIQKTLNAYMRKDFLDAKKLEVAIEMIASYGMAVGKETFETCVWIGRFYQLFDYYGIEPNLIYRMEERKTICHSPRANDSNITQALIDRFAPYTENKGKGTKKNPGYFYGFKKDIWQAMAVAVTYHDLYMKEGG